MISLGLQSDLMNDKTQSKSVKGQSKNYLYRILQFFSPEFFIVLKGCKTVKLQKQTANVQAGKTTCNKLWHVISLYVKNAFHVYFKFSCYCCFFIVFYTGCVQYTSLKKRYRSLVWLLK